MKTFWQDFSGETRKEVEISIWDQDITFKILMLNILNHSVKLTFDDKIDAYENGKPTKR